MALKVDYEVWRNLLISPRAGVFADDYIDSDLEDISWEAGLEADYRMNCFWSLGARYLYSAARL